MSMYNPLEYSQNYSMTSGSLWKYYREEIDGVNDNASDGKSFKCKIKIVGKIPERPERPRNKRDADRSLRPPVPALNVEVTFPLICFRNVWRFLDLPLINCEIELDLSWTEDCGLSEHHNNINGATFQINNAKTLCSSYYFVY